MPEIQSGMKCARFLQPRKLQIAGVFEGFSWTYLTFFNDRLNQCKREKLKYTCVYEGIKIKYRQHGRKVSTSNKMESGVTLPYISQVNYYQLYPQIMFDRFLIQDSFVKPLPIRTQE